MVKFILKDEGGKATIQYFTIEDSSQFWRIVRVSSLTYSWESNKDTG